MGVMLRQPHSKRYESKAEAQRQRFWLKCGTKRVPFSQDLGLEPWT